MIGTWSFYVAHRAASLKAKTLELFVVEQATCAEECSKPPGTSLPSEVLCKIRIIYFALQGFVMYLLKYCILVIKFFVKNTCF